MAPLCQSLSTFISIVSFFIWQYGKYLLQKAGGGDHTDFKLEESLAELDAKVIVWTFILYISRISNVWCPYNQRINYIFNCFSIQQNPKSTPVWFEVHRKSWSWKLDSESLDVFYFARGSFSDSQQKFHYRYRFENYT